MTFVVSRNDKEMTSFTLLLVCESGVRVSMLTAYYSQFNYGVAEVHNTGCSHWALTLVGE